MKEQQTDKRENNPDQKIPEKEKPYKHTAFNEIKEENQQVSESMSENLPNNSPLQKSKEITGDVVTKLEDELG